jgi:hypothetical protein
MTTPKKTTTNSGRKAPVKKPVQKPAPKRVTNQLPNDQPGVEAPKAMKIEEPVNDAHSEYKANAQTEVPEKTDKSVKIGASVFPFDPAEVPKLVLEKELPEGMEVQRPPKCIVRIKFKGTINNEINLLNHYTDELRKAFKMASMAGWKAIFFVNNRRYVSTL